MKRFFALVFCLAAILLAGCQKEPSLTISGPASLELGVDGGSQTLTFTANRDWTVSSSDSWVSVSPSSGKASDKPVSVTVRCNANTTYDDRSATVTIRMEGLTHFLFCHGRQSRTTVSRNGANGKIVVVLAQGAVEFRFVRCRNGI